MRTIALCKNVSANGRLAKSRAPTFYFISPKLIELESWNLVRWQTFTSARALYKNLSAEWRLVRPWDQQPLISRTSLRYVTYVRLMSGQWCMSSSVTLVHPTQSVKLFDNIFTRFCTLGIWGGPCKLSRRSAQGNPSTGGVKYKRGRRNMPIWVFRG